MSLVRVITHTHFDFRPILLFVSDASNLFSLCLTLPFFINVSPKRNKDKNLIMIELFCVIHRLIDFLSLCNCSVGNGSMEALSVDYRANHLSIGKKPLMMTRVVGQLLAPQPTI